MAALPKSFASMLLLVGVLSIPTISAWGEEAPDPSPVSVNVTILVHKYLNKGGLYIVGNASEYGNGHINSAPPMTFTPEDVWVLTKTLTGDKGYKVTLWLEDCQCTSSEDHSFRVPSTATELVAEVLTGYDCSGCEASLKSKSMNYNPIRGVLKM